MTPLSFERAIDNFFEATSGSTSNEADDTLIEGFSEQLLSATKVTSSRELQRGFGLLLEQVRISGEASKNHNATLQILPHLIYGASPEIQTELVKICLSYLQQDLPPAASSSNAWLEVAYILSANYAAIHSYALRRELIGQFKDLVKYNERYKKESFIRDLLYIYDRMQLESLERLSERLHPRSLSAR